MTVTGIIAEFNPFHNGHKYLLDHAEGIKIVAMSGNFVQRGEPAIVDKWIRAQMALENGADLVVELPFFTAVQSADYFASGAVDILSRLGIDSLTFGTEEVLDYQTIADVYSEKSEEMEAFVESLPSDLSYPQKTQKMWEKFAGVDFTGNTPNHILGLAYAKACAGKGITLNPIQRQGAGYHSLDKKYLSPRRPVYVSTKKIVILWISSCPIANFFKLLHRSLGIIISNYWFIRFLQTPI